MISYKTDKELDVMAEGGKILNTAFSEAMAYVKEGVTTQEIDAIAEATIRRMGGEPAFMRVKGYSWTTCICINEQVVHTPPSYRKIQSGDIVTVDMGVFYKGFNTDKADTILVGDGPEEIKRFLKAGRKALQIALSKAKKGEHIGLISQTIDKTISEDGYYVIRDLTGHGIGPELHEDPLIPGVLYGKLKKTPQIETGMALAIEVMYAQSETEISSEKDSDWSLITENGSLSAQFEETIGIYEKKALILS